MNRKFPKITTLVFFLFVITFLVACVDGDRVVHDVNDQIKACTGKMLTLEEVEEKKKDLKYVIEHYKGKNIARDKGGYIWNWPAELECYEPEDYEITENTRFDIKVLEKDEETDIYKGIKIIAYEIDPSSENAKDLSEFDEDDEDDFTELTTETTETEPEGMSVEEYREYIKGWWVNDEDHKTICYTDMFDALSLLGLNVDYSIDSETTGLKVSVTGEAKDGTVADMVYIFVYLNDNNMKFIIPSSGETICERTTAPEEST